MMVIAGCSSTPDIKPPTSQSEHPVIDLAMRLQGMPYRYGKASPEEGFDCSGFVMYVYRQYGVHLPRTTKEMASVLAPVEPNDLRSGDLLFFNTNGRKYSHVGIFINDDKFIHAPNKRIGHVLISSLNSRYWRRHFTGIRRPGKH